MNEARAEELGLKPLAGRAGRDRPLETKTDLARYFARMFKLNLINPLVGFVDGDAQAARPRDPVRVSGRPWSSRSRLLPQGRRQAPRIPEKYVALLTSCSRLQISRRPRRRPGTSSASKRRLARAHWTNVESRDAVKTYNKRALADLREGFPGFDWAAWTTELGIAQAPASRHRAAKLTSRRLPRR